VIPVTSRESWDAIHKLFLAGNTSSDLGGFVPDQERKKPENPEVPAVFPARKS
jgi:hypothetical protein